jgi:hypothetical protein
LAVPAATEAAPEAALGGGLRLGCPWQQQGSGRHIDYNHRAAATAAGPGSGINPAHGGALVRSNRLRTVLWTARGAMIAGILVV